MDSITNIAVEVLRLVPLTLAFYVPALMGMAIWKERGEGYRVKAALTLAIGFGLIIAVHVMVRTVSLVQVAGVIGISLVQIAAALVLAALTVYKLAD